MMMMMKVELKNSDLRKIVGKVR